ncbi:MAG: ABC transporter ATP-binding protein [Oscillospiraceae bacterium]|nr:ABC transporter ATP-binding protein [Oscillospiraceae bacterium]
MSKIEIKNLHAEYTDKNGLFLALKDVSFSVKEGEFISVIGSSGCGKSTLLGVLQGILTPSSGNAFIDGRPITGPGTDRAAVFQHYSLFPWMTVRKNIAFGLKQVKKNLTRSERYAAAHVFLKKVGLTGFEHKYPFQLSGGMQQRAAIARALAMDTNILLMDEPFGAIGAKNRSNMQELLLTLWEGDGQSRKKTVVFVTHDIDEAIFLSDRIIMLTNSPGQIAAEFDVHFPRPRIHSTIRKTGEYINLRNKLMTLFYDENTGAAAEEEYAI